MKLISIECIFAGNNTKSNTVIDGHQKEKVDHIEYEYMNTRRKQPNYMVKIEQ